MGNGYMGKILWVDLSRGTFEEERVADRVYEQFLSGYGLAAYTIFNRQPAGVDPLGPDNIFGVASGLLTGTGVSFSGRWTIVGKSPLTGGWGDANCGGNFAPALKRTGYDAIFFTGISPHPVYLLIDGEGHSLVDASDLWGRDAFETEDALREKHGPRFRVACIGPGAENGALISGVVNDHGRVAARSGLGAVMGAKRLKALCLQGRAKVSVVDRKKLTALTRAFNHRLTRDEQIDRLFSRFIPAVLGRLYRRMTTQVAMAGELFKYSLRKWGTSGITAMSAESGDSPVKNWKGIGFRDFPIGKKSYKISDDRVIRYQYKKYGCHACPISCGGRCSVREGAFPLAETHKPEYETLSALGTLLLVDDLHLIYHVNDLLNRAGIDTISCGVVIAFAFEAFERGILKETDTAGLRLVWGDGDALLQLVQKIVKGEGIGALLGQGVKKAAERLGQGAQEFAMHVGGQELPMHDARYDPGFGLAYEVEPTPGRHTISSYQYTDLMALHRKTRRLGRPKPYHGSEDRFALRGQGIAQSVTSSYMDVVNGCGLCLFGVAVGGNPPLDEWINAATGWRFSFDDYLETGRRIKTLRHAFNWREGLRPDDSRLPDRARGVPPQDEGPLAGISPDFDGLSRQYFMALGWDTETGKPHRPILVQLGLEWVADALDAAGAAPAVHPMVPAGGAPPPPDQVPPKPTGQTSAKAKGSARRPSTKTAAAKGKTAAAKGKTAAATKTAAAKGSRGQKTSNRTATAKKPRARQANRPGDGKGASRPVRD